MSTSPIVLPETHPADTVHVRSQRDPRPLLVCLPSLPAEATAAVLRELGRVLPPESMLVASPEQMTEQPAGNGLPALVPYAAPRAEGEWVLEAGDYAAAAQVAEERHARGVLLLGPDAGSLSPEAIETMAAGLFSDVDLLLPRYRTAPADGLVNAALLYPLTRALFAADVRFPLPLDAGLSLRMLSRLAGVARRSQQSQEEPLLWPVAEASLAGYTVRQVEGGARTLPRPQETDLSTLFPMVTGSLFADLEAKAAYWQRARPSPPARASGPTRRDGLPANADDAAEVHALIEGFRLAFANLREIWSLVLPPQSLLALKKLATGPQESFTFAPALWARTVYDFALAFHLHTLNRGHLLGALTPLYLGWVASFLRTKGLEGAAAGVLDGTAAAFEQEKPYLVARWRWPDRFNP